MEASFLQLLKGYEYLFKQQEELARPAHAHVAYQNGSDTRELQICRGEKYDSFSAYKGQYTNANSRETV